MEMYVWAPTSIALVSILLILVTSKCTAPRSSAVRTTAENIEIDFALSEGQTIVGVLDTTRAMCFHIGNDMRESKDYE